MYKNQPNYEIFTPPAIVDIMMKFYNNEKKILDPCVGTGNLLTYFDLYGHSDITAFDIKDMLDPKKKEYIKFHNEDFLKSTLIEKFDFIIMNPPFIKIQNLHEDYVKFLTENILWPNIGNFDIYFAFLVKSVEMLANYGTLVAIIPNSWIYNKSGHYLRKFLMENKLLYEIIDFGDKIVFTGVLTYTCILVLRKNSTGYYYTLDKREFFEYSNEYCIKNKIILGDSVKNQITKISGGIATLADKIFISKIKKFDEGCWIKMQSMKDADEFILFPYEDGRLIDEETFSLNFPNSYNYLLENKEKLLARDSGKIKLLEWFGFGRKQGINIKNINEAILIPTLIHPEKFKYKITTDPHLIFKGCIVIICDNAQIVVDFLLKNLTNICNLCSKKSGGYVTLTTTVLNQFLLK